MNVLSRNFKHEARSILSALDDPNVIEVMLDSNSQLYAEMVHGGFVPLGTLDNKESMAFLATTAHSLGVIITQKSPMLEGELPLYGYRIAAAIPPVVANPIFVIRKPAERVFTLDDYVTQGTLLPQQNERLKQAIRSRKNIVIAGGVGSGKTTLANAILHGMHTLTPTHRVLVIEDTRELQFQGSFGSVLRTSDEVSLLDLTRLALRCRPDRVVVGEVRTGEVAVNALKALSTGTPGGLFTIHADSALETLFRLEELILEISPNPLSTLIGRAVDVIVFMERGEIAGQRNVKEIIEVHGFDRAAELYRTSGIFGDKDEATISSVIN